LKNVKIGGVPVGKLKAGLWLTILIILGMFFITGVGGEKTDAGTRVKTSQNDENIPPAPQEKEEQRKEDTTNNIPPVATVGNNNAGNKTNNTNSKVFVPPARGYWIEVSTDEQKTRIYYDGNLIKEWDVSTGTEDKPTPIGVFKIQNRGEWFFSEKYQQGGRWWVSFKDWGVYLFHSVPMDREKRVIVEEAARLGTPASHGCVRLATENAKWIYDNIPQGTPVYIH
jgi:lipoprotein-anchoring transpeptidase ErfK/SrfK